MEEPSVLEAKTLGTRNVSGDGNKERDVVGGGAGQGGQGGVRVEGTHLAIDEGSVEAGKSWLFHAGWTRYIGDRVGGAHQS
jgi:hypothetical protein